MGNVIEMRSITKFYGKGGGRVTALDGVSLNIGEGEFAAVLGPSGSGKTTLMNIVGLIDTPDSGEYLLDGLDITKMKDRAYTRLRNQKIGFVFQRFNLIPKYSALYNVALPLLLGGMGWHQARARAAETLERVGLSGRTRHKPNELSGGQIQRVAIARALVGGCSLILADEPTGALDRKTGAEVLDFMKELNNEGKTIIMITHDHNIAARAGRVIRVEDGKVLSA